MISLNLSYGARKHSISLSPSQTLACALKRFCEKFDLDVGKYTLKHRNVQLDLSLEFRLSGLPNRANLEVCKNKSDGLKNEGGLVKVALRMEGNRFVLEVLNTSTLWEILQRVESERGLNLLSAADSNSKYLQPCMRYMSSVFCSNADLRRMTLSALGVRCQSVLFDFFYQQTDVEVWNFLEKDIAEWEKEKNRAECEREKDSGVERKGTDVAEKGSVCVSSIDSDKGNALVSSSSDNMEMLQRDIEENVSSTINEEVKKENYFEERILPIHLEGGGITDPVMSDFHKYIRDMESLKSKQDDHPLKLPVITDRDIKVLFPDKDLSKMELSSDLPPDFFELSAEEILSSFKRREDPDQLILKTRAMRERSMVNFDKCLIRIRLPDGMKIQGTFHPQEKTEDVMEFIKSQLSESNRKVEFYLYTSPPKTELKKGTTLLAQNLAPASLLILGLRSGQNMTAPILSSECLKERLPLYKETVGEDVRFPSGNKVTSPKNAVPMQRQNPTAKARRNGPIKTAPKWFLAGKRK